MRLRRFASKVCGCSDAGQPSNGAERSEGSAILLARAQITFQANSAPSIRLLATSCRERILIKPIPLREKTDQAKLRRVLQALGTQTRSPGRVYLTGGATAVLYGWREMTVDIDMKAEPEPGGFFEAIAHLKESESVNVKLASPDDFIPEVPGWRERSVWITREGKVDFYHYDFYSNALAKLERGHERDLVDVGAMLESGLVRRDRLRSYFDEIEHRLIRYPAIDPALFKERVLIYTVVA